MEKKEILKKLHKVMSAISYIQKDKVNEFHRYAYASEEVIKKALHKEFVDQGILLFVNILNERRDIIQVSSKTGTRETGITTINVGYEFVDIETGQSISGTFVGSGEDSGDKGLYKAITGAIKYILTTTFLIPTGNDPEKEEIKPQINQPKVSSETSEGEKLLGLATPEMQKLQKKEMIMELYQKLARKRIVKADEIKDFVLSKTGMTLQEVNYSEIIKELTSQLNENKNS